MNITNLQYFDPQGRLSSAYIIRTWFYCTDGEDFADGLYCARNKEDAFNQMLEEYAKHCPDKKVEKFELLRIDGGIENHKTKV